MKKLLAVTLSLFISLSLSGKKYFVAPGGSDIGPGSYEQPYASWDRLNSVLQPGDTGYIRGGTYSMPQWDWYESANTFCYFNNLKGTPDNYIKIWAYEDEVPVWDLTGVTESRNTSLLFHLNNCDYLHIRGLRITNASQPTNGSIIYGVYLWESSHNIIENFTLDHIGGNGYQIHGVYWIDIEDASTLNSDGNLFLNCDVYEVADPLSASPYDGSNGFAANWTGKAPNTTYRGCRAWHICDDGWDFYRGTSPNITIDNCWAFRIGYYNGAWVSSAGNGYKLGPITAEDNDNYKAFTVTNSIAAGNPMSGFTVYGMSGEITFYNNLSFDNSYTGFFTWGEGDAIWTLTNNLSYNPKVGSQSQAVDHWGDHRYWLEATNVWDNYASFVPPNILHDVDIDDFVSVDIMEMTRPRKPGGALPDIDFGHLIPESPLKDVGTIVGLPFVDDYPEIGPFEIVIGGSAAEPEYVSSYVEDPNTDQIIITLSLQLSNTIIPAFNDFTVEVNSVRVNVVDISISGADVRLTLAQEIKAGDVVSVSYTMPSTNRLQTIFGGEAQSFEDKRVANLVGLEGNTNLIAAVLYPNPTHDNFYIQIYGDPPSSDLIIRIYNYTGTLVHQEPLTPNMSIVNVAIDPFPGAYIVEIGSRTETLFAQKLIIN